MIRLLVAELLAAAPLALLAACSRPSADPSFAADWSAWHARRLERLRVPDGWLALSGLHWLTPGENRLPGLPGVFLLEGDRVTLVAASADGYTLDGAPVTRRALEILKSIAIGEYKPPEDREAAGLVPEPASPDETSASEPEASASSEPATDGSAAEPHAEQ